MAPTSTDEDKKDDSSQSKGNTAESAVSYTGDDTVVGDNNRVGGEESLAQEPPQFIQYGGEGQVGDGLRHPGWFRTTFGCKSANRNNLVSIPYRRVG